MDLKNGKIKVHEVLADPQAMAIFEREFGELAHSPLVQHAGNMTLSKIVKLARGKIDDAQIERILNELTAL